MKTQSLRCRCLGGVIEAQTGRHSRSRGNLVKTARYIEPKLKLFRACFSGLEHAYGTYDPRTGAVRQVKQSVTDRVLLDHLRGRQPYGVYLLVGDQTNAVVADFDDDDPTLPVLLIDRARNLQIHAYLERSKRKGWHVWIMLARPGVSAVKARAVMRQLLSMIKASHTEIFPKQDRLEGRNRYGNFINAPLYGRLVPEGRTVFVNPVSLEPYQDQAAKELIEEERTRLGRTSAERFISDIGELELDESQIQELFSLIEDSLEVKKKK